MKKTKRITALVLAVLTLLGSFFAITASAATSTISFDFCYDSANNIIKYKQTVTNGSYTVGTTGEALCRIKADGKDAYCIEPGKTLKAGDKLDSASSTAWKSLSEGQRTAVNLAILYGKGGNSSALGGTEGQQWIATQLIVWEIVTGCRKTTGDFACSNNKFLNGICSGDSNPGVKSIYNKISNALADHGTIPSFAKVTKSSAPTHEMSVSSGKYTLKLTDSNKILSKFSFKKTGDVSVSTSGNTLTLSSSKPVDSAVTFTSAKTMPSVSSTSSIVAYGSSSLQDVVKGVGKPDPINVYFKVVTKSGDLKIVKTSEDGVVANIEFKITGTNYSKTAKTDSKGVITLNDLVPGTYKVTETTADRYVPQETHTVTVVAGKTATVTFNNVLKRGNVTVEKAADDGKISGVKFHLYGTSADGIKVDQYATTDSKGVAKFTDILVSAASKPYTIEEIDTPDRYLITSAQNVTVKWKGTAKVKFENKLKKATVFTITKSGEVFYGVKQSTDEKYGTIYQPVYQKANLSGAVYQIKAAADIVTDDGKKYYSKGDLVDTVTTGADGVAKSKELYLGKYTITETKAPQGMVLNSTPQTVELTTANQTVALSETKVDFVNDRQKMTASLNKVMERNETFNIGNADEIKSVRFGLYATEQLKATSGAYIPKDGLIEVMEVSEGGKVTVKSDLPFGKYYVKEIATDEHYILGEDKLAINFSYQGQSKKTVDIPINNGNTYINKLIYGSVNGVKVDEYNNKLGGAVIGLFKNDETTFTEATAILKTTSADDGSFNFNNIPYGSYIVREIKQPTGFVLSLKSYPVVISENKQTVSIEIENRHIKGNITLTKVDEDYPENKLTGATFEVYKDVNGDGKLNTGDKLIGNLEENNEGIYDMKDLDYGMYFVKETKAPDGFELDNGVYSVNITEDNKTYAVENKAGVGFINKAMKGSLKIVKTSSDGKVEGFSFRVTGVDGYDNVFKTDKNGIINITGLRIGEYKVSEVEDTVSNSYILPDDQTVVIKRNTTAQVKMYNKLKEVPKTGDNSNMPLWFGIGGISLAGIGAAMYFLLRKKRDE